MAHARDDSPSDDRYEKSLLEELEDVATSAPVDPSDVLFPEQGEGVAEVFANLRVEQNPRVILGRKLHRVSSRALSIKRQGNVPNL